MPRCCRPLTDLARNRLFVVPPFGGWQPSRLKPGLRTERCTDSRPRCAMQKSWRLCTNVVFAFALCLGAGLEAPGQPAVRKDTVTVDEKTEAVIKGGLKWLVSKQMANGAWGVSGDEQRYPVAMTGYALMAFQAAGQLPGEGEFGKNVTLGMNYLQIGRAHV